MKKSLIFLLALLLVFVSVTTCAPVLGDTVYNLEYLQNNKILEGYEDGSLGLTRTVTRAELAKMVCTAAGLTMTETAVFPDVPADHWAYGYIGACAEVGCINGYPDGTFLPENPVKCEEAAKILLSLFAPGYYTAYPLDYMAAALEKGYLDGVTATLGRDAARGDIAAMLCAALTDKETNGAETETPYNGIYATGGTAAVKLAESNATYDMAVAPGAVMPAPMPIIEDYPPMNTEEYTKESENIFKDPATSPLSTFSVDADTASYSNMRRFLTQGALPEVGAVRTEELLNYFSYDYPLPTDDTPFSVTTEVGVCPWNTENTLVRIGLKGAELSEPMPSNITLLLDVSGSMYSENKLPLVKKAMALLLENCNENDRFSIVTYAGNTQIALDGASGAERGRILEVLDGLQAYGSTAGASGIQLAYEVARRNKIDGNNRVILCTDGDFNVGVSSTAALEELIAEERGNGIFLSVLGFGMGNYKDNRMETLADKGDGNYAYIDNVREAKKVLVQDMTKTLFTIAKDVKIQVEFNPAAVGSYRLIGYENRHLENEDFANDAKDAGEIGAGHTITALYELTPPTDSTAALRYQTATAVPSEELLYVKLRYKLPNETESRLLETPVANTVASETTDDFRFAAAVAELGMLLNRSAFSGSATCDTVLSLAEGAKGADTYGLRAEFVQLAAMARYTLERTNDFETVAK